MGKACDLHMMQIINDNGCPYCEIRRLTVALERIARLDRRQAQSGGTAVDIAADAVRL